MLAELGVFCLILAACFSFLSSVFSPIAYAKSNIKLMSYTPRLTYFQAFFCLSAFLILAVLFVRDDFSVAYVLNNSSVSLPWWYKWCALWGGHEGSMLLWVSLLTAWSSLVCFFSSKMDCASRALLLSILSMISLGFYLFILLTSNPFIHAFEPLGSNGRDLNPLLQDIGFIFHPPMLYTGYVGFSVAFAFALTSLIRGYLDKEFARLTRIWTLIAWCALSLGITLGSWWAYRELGWGGWWFWDPVENASLMPWLVGTALLHSLIVSEKRNALKGWTVLLALVTFVLSLIGTFLVRSGVLTSVHAFAVSPERGLYMLGFLMITIVASLITYALRIQKFNEQASFSSLSKESMMLLNNVFLTVMMATVLLGTLYPLIIDALNLGKISVGPPYFEKAVAPMMLPLLFLMGIAPHTFWKTISFELVIQRLKQSAFLTAIFVVSFYFSPLEHKSPLLFLGTALAVWVLITTLISFFASFLRPGSYSYIKSVSMVIAHTGVAITILGICISQSFSVEKFVRMGIGDRLDINHSTLTFVDEQQLNGPNYHGYELKMRLDEKGRQTWLFPQKRKYDVSSMVMTDSDIHYNLFRDVYVSLGEPLNNGQWSIRIYYKPFVRWIWAGGLLIFLGGVIAIFNLLNGKIKRPTRIRNQGFIKVSPQ